MRRTPKKRPGLLPPDPLYIIETEPFAHHGLDGLGYIVTYHPKWGKQVWELSHASRREHRDALTGRPIPPGEPSFLPVTRKSNERSRISIDSVSGAREYVLELRQKPLPPIVIEEDEDGG